jgi:Family of unknown function (DUF6338)
VIPGSALAVVFVVAAFGPGYLYLRVAERRISRAERSGLVEAVELAVIGAFASTLALLAVAAIAQAAGLLDIYRFAADPHHYWVNHPLRILWLIAVVLACAYGMAYLAARFVHRRATPSIRPGSGWTEIFLGARRDNPNLGVRITAELRDGRRIEGTLGGHTTEKGENRELCLFAPLRVKTGPEADTETLEAETFIFLRESDILAMSGWFFPTSPPEPTPGWLRRRGAQLRRLGAQVGRRVLKRRASN